MSQIAIRKVRKDAKYGLSTQALETAIMDLYEANHTYDEIAEKLNIRLETAKKIAGYMREGRTDRLAGPTEVANASAALAAAIRRYHPDRCGQ